MTGSDANPVATLIDSFVAAPTGRLEEAYQRLVGALWRDGLPTELALPAVPHLVACLDQVDEVRQGHLSILLGLLAEVEYPAADGKVNSAVRSGLDRYLVLWRRAPKGLGLSLALQYLVAHFPGDSRRILAVADELGLDVDDRSRLDRALLRFDPDDPEPEIGRAFPYPTAWEMDESERAHDRAQVKALTAEQVEAQWHKDTRTVLGFTGARAYWAVRHGAPAPIEPDSLAPRYPDPPEADIEIFRRHEAAFHCPSCGGRGLAFESGLARCPSCAKVYRITRGMLDVTAPDGGGVGGADFLSQLVKIPTMSHFIESKARPNFKRLCGFTWDGPVSAAFEEKRIAELVRPVEGPVLDLAAGPGGFTLALTKAVGHQRVIALDQMPTMLASLRDRLPQVPAVVANARTLPFGDDTLGAVMCWNGPHAFIFEDTAPIFAEIGRCLRPGGTFTTYSFRNSEDPIYRYFVASHHFPQSEHGLEMYDLDEFKGWLDQAGLVVREESSIGLAFFITAEKRAPGERA
ncbi:class I SAM-dependent methyltransferase [Actinomadura alba]|uniref:Class I SAM-dependent methyltransferase n=1 Tax=Actinomadura alba TaxID=406431 RepID=A0ABR7LRX7_9ACTN|nr:class I SAM-dependent methyltransferase [Actinomadura alba]MBC6467529.1 class I SAM-dependent methyltransferase [Actinomadura alba]